MNSLVQLKSPAGVHRSVAELAGVKSQLFSKLAVSVNVHFSPRQINLLTSSMLIM